MGINSHNPDKDGEMRNRGEGRGKWTIFDTLLEEGSIWVLGVKGRRAKLYEGSPFIRCVR